MSSPKQRSIAFYQCLGSGGFGDVYLATLLDRSEAGPVAVKVLKTGLDPKSQSVQRLRDEARLLHLLDHPNILSVVDLIAVHGRVALVSEYFGGKISRSSFSLLTRFRWRRAYR